MNWFQQNIKISNGFPKINPNSTEYYYKLLSKTKYDNWRKNIIKDLIEDVALYSKNWIKIPVMSRTDKEKFRQLQERIHKTEFYLDVPFQFRAFTTQEQIEEREKENEYYRIENLKKRKDCNIKVLELDQWSATAENVEWTNLLNFDPELLFGGSSKAIEDLGLKHYQIKFVCENESPPPSKIWLRDINNKLKIWKSNYES